LNELHGDTAFVRKSDASRRVKRWPKHRLRTVRNLNAIATGVKPVFVKTFVWTKSIKKTSCSSTVEDAGTQSRKAALAPDAWLHWID
jgi:hypothetical protein